MLAINLQYPHTTSPDWSSYISLKNKWREFDKRSKNFTLIDHDINSDGLFPFVSVILLLLRPASLMHRNLQRWKIVAVNFSPAITCILVDTSFCCSKRFFFSIGIRRREISSRNVTWAPEQSNQQNCALGCCCKPLSLGRFTMSFLFHNTLCLRIPYLPKWLTLSCRVLE